MSNYPVSYRRASRSESGFQPGTAPRPRAPTLSATLEDAIRATLTQDARFHAMIQGDDSTRRLRGSPSAGSDQSRYRPTRIRPPEMTPAQTGAARAAQALGGLTRAARLHPAVRIASTALDVARVADQLANPGEFASEGMWEVPQFTLISRCINPPPTPDWQGNSGTIGCLTLQAGGLPLPSGVGATITRVHIARKDQSFGTRWRTVYLWGRVGTGVVTPYNRPAVPMRYSRELALKKRLGIVPEALDAMSQPIAALPSPLAPTPVPYSLAPYRRHNPWRSPTEQSFRGPGRPTRPPNEVFPVAPPEPPGQPPRARRKLTPQDPRRRKREKEKKVKGNKVVQLALKAALAATEVIDVVEAVYRALPYEVRAAVNAAAKDNGYRYARPQHMAWAILTHADEIDMRKAVTNIIMNHYTDKVVGGVAGRAGRNLRKFGGSLSTHMENPAGVAGF